MRNEGSALVAVLALGTILAMAVYFSLRAGLDSVRRERLREIELDIRDIRDHLERTVNCPQSGLTAAACASGPVTLKNGAGDEVVAAAGTTRIGNRLVSATCEANRVILRTRAILEGDRRIEGNRWRLMYPRGEGFPCPP